MKYRRAQGDRVLASRSCSVCGSRGHRAPQCDRVEAPLAPTLDESLAEEYRGSITKALCVHRDGCIDLAIEHNRDEIDCRGCISYRKDPALDAPTRRGLSLAQLDLMAGRARMLTRRM
jgi:hypothetical protein